MVLPCGASKTKQVLLNKRNGYQSDVDSTARRGPLPATAERQSIGQPQVLGTVYWAVLCGARCLGCCSSGCWLHLLLYFARLHVPACTALRPLRPALHSSPSAPAAGWSQSRRGGLWMIGHRHVCCNALRAPEVARASLRTFFLARRGMSTFRSVIASRLKLITRRTSSGRSTRACGDGQVPVRSGAHTPAGHRWEGGALQRKLNALRNRWCSEWINGGIGSRLAALGRCASVKSRRTRGSSAGLLGALRAATACKRTRFWSTMSEMTSSLPVSGP